MNYTLLLSLSSILNLLTSKSHTFPTGREETVHDLQLGLKNFFKIIWIGIASVLCIDLFSLGSVIGIITSWRDQYESYRDIIFVAVFPLFTLSTVLIWFSLILFTYIAFALVDFCSSTGGDPIYAILDILVARGIRADSLLYQTIKEYMEVSLKFYAEKLLFSVHLD